MASFEHLGRNGLHDVQTVAEFTLRPRTGGALTHSRPAHCRSAQPLNTHNSHNFHDQTNQPRHQRQRRRRQELLRHELRSVSQRPRHRLSRDRQRSRELHAQAIPPGIGLHKSRTQARDRRRTLVVGRCGSPDRAFPLQTEAPHRRPPRRIHMDPRRLLPGLAHHGRHWFRQDRLRHHAATFPSLSERADMGRTLHRRQRDLLGDPLADGEALRP